MFRETVKNILLSIVFLIMGLFIPFVTNRVQGLGNVLLPMHFPVLLCGLICGGRYGATVGIILPLLRSHLFSMPVMYPDAVGMAFELATYGAFSGALYKRKKDISWLYLAMITAMVAGRVVWGITRAIFMDAVGEVFTFEMFVGAAIFESIPGIILQLLLIPAMIFVIEKPEKEKTNDKASV